MFPPPESGAFHVLCVGDSLTEGYTAFGTNFCPYTDELQRLLAGVLTVPVVVYNEGRSGDTLLGPHMRLRLSDSIDEAQNAGVAFDWVIIMAGINDVGRPQVTAQMLFEGMETMVGLAAPCATNVLILNCMETTLDRNAFNPILEKVTAYNALLEKVTAYNALLENRLVGRPKVHFLDMRSALPYDKQLFDDHVHLTCVGYKKMGEIIFRKMQDVGLANAQM